MTYSRTVPAYAVMVWLAAAAPALCQEPPEPPQPPPQAEAAPASTAPSERAGYLPLWPGWTKPDDRLIDTSTVFYSCGVGGSLGIFTLAIYPLTSWTSYSGAIASTGAMLLRGGLGCYAAVLAAGAYSGTRTVLHNVGQTLHSLF
ncbi:MAG: hypothetical protein GC191_10275 [Azospirillum sp.]|nr:hypothetical protein [Azospirillum sp.]